MSIRNLVVGVAIVMTTIGNAHAIKCDYPDCPWDPPPTIAAVVSFGKNVLSMVSELGSFLKTLIPLQTAQIQGEIAKGTTAKIQTSQAISQYKTTTDLKVKAAEIDEVSKQEPSLCQSVATTDILATSTKNARISLGSNSLRFAEDTMSGQPAARRAKSLASASKDSRGADVRATTLYGADDGTPEFDEKRRAEAMLNVERMVSLGTAEDISTARDRAAITQRERKKIESTALSSSASAFLFITEARNPGVKK